MDDLSAANLSKEARAAADNAPHRIAGEREEALRLYRQALAVQPEDKNAWMELAALVEDADEKRQALERVLALDPFHEEARAALARLDGGDPASPPPPLFCANHPNRQTMLRCNKCNKPICPECAVQTPVGYRCKECVRGLQAKFYTADSRNQAAGYAAAALAGLLLGGAGFLLGLFMAGFFGLLLAFFLGPALGGALSELIWRAMGRKRARNFNLIAVLIAGVIAAPLSLLSGNLFVGLLLVGMALSTIYARLR